ncbi:GNAT family acetyltransferase [Poseidonibacter lekithochrous]|uniref:GNAT family acetyltransferase n=1 Tax=Poseidonibacter TaxID=2321187 RepID=UPI001C0859C4|nr:MULTISPECIES: GNAT family acetyltransferase [Poseidonibacter]MBU3014113.1 GNAT family acetyltransferase [Poseidonibacter lekithochrous]MDO6827411.1 GNAT family acetyltransferase [Poseidonibacter sp. 1_MG-2023]
MQLKIAQLKDIDNILKLHAKYQLATIKEEDKKDGFVTTGFSYEELKDIIEQERGIFIAVEDDIVLGYVMSASWQFWSKWPMFVHMIKDLPKLNYLGQTLSIDNSYQYGPVCIDKSVRGSGLLEKLFDFALESMSKKYPILVTFVNKINERSYEAHKRKLGLDVIQEFEFNSNNYYEMVYDTSKRVQY